MHIYAHTNLSSPLFPNLPSYNSNPAVSFSLAFSKHFFSFFVPLVSSLAFCLYILISSPSLTSFDQVSRAKSRRERERERRRKRGLNYLPPRSAHQHHHYHRSQSLLRSRASIIGELAIYAWSIPPLTTRLTLSSLPLSLSRSYHPIALPFSFYLPLLSHLLRNGISLTLNRNLPALAYPSRHPYPTLLYPYTVRSTFGRGYARVPPRACRGRVKPCVRPFTRPSVGRRQSNGVSTRTARSSSTSTTSTSIARVTRASKERSQRRQEREREQQHRRLAVIVIPVGVMNAGPDRCSSSRVPRRR